MRPRATGAAKHLPALQSAVLHQSVQHRRKASQSVWISSPATGISIDLSPPGPYEREVHDNARGAPNPLFGFQQGVMVVGSRSQLGRPA